MALIGKTVLVTRSKESSSGLCSILESHGTEVICFPSIEIKDPDSWDLCDEAIWKLSEYSSVCFTSKNSVTKFIERIRIIRPQAVDILTTRNIFAVGEKTKKSLETCGFPVTAAPKNSSADELAQVIRDHQIKDAKILFPKSDIAKDTLPKQLRSMGASVDEIVVYRTVIPEPDKVEVIQKKLAADKIDFATFFSPSSIVNFCEMIGAELLTHTSIAVIGPTTAEAAQQLGLKVDIVCQKATAEGMADALENYIR